MAPDIPPRVYYRDGRELRCGHLMHQGRVPILVISWKSKAGIRTPSVWFELDSRKLEALTPHGNLYRYLAPLGARITSNR